MSRPSGNVPEQDLERELREAFTATDPEAAWYFDRAAERVVRVSHGVTSIPDLPASDVEEDEERYTEIPALLESDVHAWMEEFVEDLGDAKVAALLDERQGANARFLKKLAGTNPPALEAWKRYESARVDAAFAAWRDSAR